ncbi:MAG: ribbon-helix-helix domain-containing protein [Candidatus Kariarchaeaceae archaeon]
MSSKLKPLTFKAPKFMIDKIDQMIESGLYKNKAELIRDAIQKMIEWEMKLSPISSIDLD